MMLHNPYTQITIVTKLLRRYFVFGYCRSIRVACLHECLCDCREKLERKVDTICDAMRKALETIDQNKYDRKS
jgi:hypothetical protein